MMAWNSIFFHSPSSFLLELVILMHDYLMLVLLSVVILVLMNMSYTFFFNSFNLSFFENHQIESVWTILPFLLLFCVISPSLSSLYMMDSCLFCGFTVFITGHQWYWSYSVKDMLEFSFDSYMMTSETNTLRLLDADNRLVIPSSMPIRFLVSSADVIHSWTIPSLGVKMDAVPGRINQFCVTPKRVGVFFGQCSEICGANHSFMPIVAEVFPFDSFLKLSE